MARRITYLLLFLCLIASPTTTYAQDEAPPPQTTESKKPYFPIEEPGEPSTDEGRFWKEMVNMFITLGMIIGILVALTWVMRKMQYSRVKYANESSLIKVIDQRPLSTKSAIYLLQVYDRALVVADSQQGITCLAEFTIDTEESKKDFNAYLKNGS